ncbi:MAG: Hpt domain-containing protein [Bdellovibrionales bacterium]
MDLTNLRDITDGDAAIEADLFQEFIQSSLRLIDALKNSQDEGSHDAWYDTAHSLKGIAINLGAIRLSDLAADAENSRDQTEGYKAGLLQSISAEHEKVLNFLQSQL